MYIQCTLRTVIVLSQKYFKFLILIIYHVTFKHNKYKFFSMLVIKPLVRKLTELQIYVSIISLEFRLEKRME